MTGDQAAEPGSPRTLREANEVLERSEPRWKAPLGEWLAHYQRAAVLYAEIAEIDRGHHHEALCMVHLAQDSVKEIEAQLPPQPPGHA